MQAVNKNIFLDKSATIRDAIKVIDSMGLRIAIIVDSDERLEGVVTDGDVRRGLLRGLTTESKVSEVMTSDPVTVQLGVARRELLSLISDYHLLAIPVLDGRRVVGLETLGGTHQVSLYDNPVFIMAGGFGKRLARLRIARLSPCLKWAKNRCLKLFWTASWIAGSVSSIYRLIIFRRL